MSRRASEARTLQALPGVLDEALAHAGLSNVVTLVKLKRSWTAIAGSQLAGVSHPVGFRWGELLVSVSDSIWLQQMTFFQAKLRDKIRRELGDARVTKLRFVLAYAVDPPPGPASPRAERQEPQTLTAGEERAVRSGTAGILNPRLREAASRAWRKDLLSKR
ncbi:MAG: DUF721 domain-containing protein [Candidatus Tectomicrobia bacterium]|nr:DUF721 domain-containing protein [Candidatus Tectomicrobia bacterium]